MSFSAEDTGLTKGVPFNVLGNVLHPGYLSLQTHMEPLPAPHLQSSLGAPILCAHPSCTPCRPLAAVLLRHQHLHARVSGHWVRCEFQGQADLAVHH